MKAGRELDALVAERVLGERIRKDVSGCPIGLPYYSTDIAAAWPVFIALDSLVKADSVAEGGHRIGQEGGKWVVLDWTELVIGEAATAPLAICLAALAVGLEVSL